MPKERNKAIPAAYLLLQNNRGELLLALRANTGYQDGSWNVPSGHVEASESPKQAMIREAKEEVGIDLKPEDLELIHLSHRPQHDETGDRIDFFFRATRWQGEAVNAEPHKCAEVRWVNPSLLPDNIIPHVRYAIAAMGIGEFYTELDEKWLKEQGIWMLD